MTATWLLQFYYSNFSTTSNTYTGKALIGISLIEMGLMFGKIHPFSISDFNITEKNLMRSAGIRKKNIKGLLPKIFLISKMCFKKTHVRKIIQFSVAEVAANFDITPTRLHVQRFTGHVHDWCMLNDWSIQKIDLLTSTSGVLVTLPKT